VIKLALLNIPRVYIDKCNICNSEFTTKEINCADFIYVKSRGKPTIFFHRKCYKSLVCESSPSLKNKNIFEIGV
jgi:hypothetical protein